MATPMTIWMMEALAMMEKPQIRLHLRQEELAVHLFVTRQATCARARIAYMHEAWTLDAEARGEELADREVFFC